MLLLQELQQVGVPLDQTLIEQQVGGDEVDCLANISGELAFFELKDKDFALGNAYSFGAKVGIVRPQHSVIFTTNKIGGDAREHFERARLARKLDPEDYYPSGEPLSEIRYIEGLEELRKGIQGLATSIYRSDALRILSRVLPLAALDPAAILSALEHRAISTPVPDSARVGTSKRSRRAVINLEKPTHTALPLQPAADVEGLAATDPD